MADNLFWRTARAARVWRRMLGTYARMDLLWFLRDTRYCLLQVAADVVCSASAVAGVFLLSAQLGGIGGMSRDEILFMLGYATLVDGVFALFFSGYNAGNISRTIGRGQLDHCVIQPVPIWIQLLSVGFSPISGSGMLVCGAALTMAAIHRLDLAAGAGWWLLLSGSVLASTLLCTAFIYIVSCLAFWAPAAAEEIAGTAHDLFTSLKSYPLGGMAPLWQTVFSTLVPVGLAAWFPSSVLLDKAAGLFGGLCFPALTFAAAAVFVMLALLIFRKGMNHYVKNSCPRYSGFGHR